MFTIGAFAHHGRVSVRMLRHYDAIGLLRPARVDGGSGYRSYEAGQLARLNRIVALKDLGFTLHQIASVLDETVGPDELRGMLRLRRSELQDRLRDDTERLAQVEARLQIIESEGAMPREDVRIRSLPAVRVAELTAPAEGFEPTAIGPVIGPLYEELIARLAAAGLASTGPAVAYYEDSPDGRVVVHASVPVDADPGGAGGVTVVDLPAVERAATIVHRGSMDTVLATIQTLARWIDAQGYRSTGYNRELYLHYGQGDDPDAWVTELQEPIAACTGART